MKRWLNVAVGIFLVISLLLAGCSSQSTNSKSENGKINLTFFYRWPNEPYKSYFKSVIADFEKQHPNINIQEVTALNDDYKQKANVLLGSATPPDVFFSWVGEYGQKFIRDGVALDLTKYFQADPNWSGQLIKSQVNQFSNDGKVYGVPLFTDSKLFFYNKDIFDKLNLKVPTTWDEFLNVLATIKKSGTTPIILGNKAPWAAAHYVTALNQRMVPKEVLAKDLSYQGAQFSDSGYVEALKKLNELRPYFNDNPNAIAHDEARNLFLGGKAAITFLETMEITFMKDATFKWDTFKVPTIDGAKGDQEGLIGAPEGFMVDKKSAHPKEAVEFLKFMTSKINGEKLIKDTGLASTVDGAVNANTATDHEVKAMQLIKDSKDMLIWTDSALDTRVFKPYGDGIQTMLGGGMTPEQVMKNVQDAAKQVKQ
ncbi:ABC transporter substrate-binding protein [Neobacillus ginsengisoli]|uniref:Raffinose/stachyose/melibiose transport system substrate-binding protein n=1 Tax=Neobacillus ginsengisoli TaxID=904295 RepID=A0ABT9XZ72_9BACI|nr:extracellular solute-binding protein [Neobacillus ginsengisoli]MDQ0200858.1 raffinose/stachyose/melibiose transport system substrate-binding protein [Neobacillus ginsengisoli]